MLTDKRGASMAEAAIALPVVLLVIMFGWNVSRAASTAMTARDAADYAARVAAVARTNPEQWARDAAQASLNQSGGPGFCCIDAVDVEILQEGDGEIVRVTVSWRHPTLFAGLCSVVGGSCRADFTGAAVAVWRREEW